MVIATLINFYLQISDITGYGSSIEYTDGLYSLLKSIIHVLLPTSIALTSIVNFNTNQNVSNNYKLIYFILLTVNIILGLLSGMKEVVMIPIVICLYYYIKFHRKFPLIFIISIVFFVAILYPLNNSYRNFLNDSRFEKSSRIEILGLVLNQSIKEKNFFNLLKDGQENYKNRLELYSNLSDAIAKAVGFTKIWIGI